MTIKSARTTRDFARIWFYWKIPAILLFCLIVICVGLWVFTATPMYKSAAKIMVFPKPSEESVLSPGQNRDQYLARPVNAQDINTEIQLLKSNYVAKKTIEFYSQKASSPKQTTEKPGKSNFFGFLNFTDKQELTDAEKKAKSLTTALKAEPVITSNLISVSLESPYQDQVADILDTMLEIYMDYRKKTFSTLDTEAFYGEQKGYYAEKLATATKRLKDFRSRWNITNIDSQIQANLDLIKEFVTQLNNLEIQISENRAKIQQLKKGLSFDSGAKEFTIPKEMRRMPVIVELAKGLVPLLIKRTEIGKTFTKQSREYKQIDDQIKMIRQEIKNEISDATTSNIMANKTLQTKQGLLKNKIQNLKEESHNFQQKQDEHASLQLNVQIARDNFLKYGEKKENARMFRKRDEKNLSNVAIAEKPSIPRRPASPNKLLAMEVAIILGLFAALLLPFVLETFDHSLKTADDVEYTLSLPVVCTYNEA